MRYALLIYVDVDARDRMSDEERRRMNAAVAAVVARPDVAGYLRLHRADSATTVRDDGARMLLTDGPFVDSKDYLGGFVLVEAESLDGALAVAEELQRTRDGAGAIEIRPVDEEPLAGA